MRNPRAATLLFWSLATLATLFFLLFVLVLVGVVPVDSGADRPLSRGTPEETAAPLPRVSTTTEQPRSTATRAAPAAQRVTVVVTATRGDCWLLARAGSEKGRTLEEGVLTRGSSTTLRARRIWLSLGASGNVDVTVNGKRSEIATGTVAVTFEPTASA